MHRCCSVETILFHHMEGWGEPSAEWSAPQQTSSDATSDCVEGFVATAIPELLVLCPCFPDFHLQLKLFL